MGIVRGHEQWLINFEPPGAALNWAGAGKLGEVPANNGIRYGPQQ